jgi:hypothetical protein
MPFTTSSSKPTQTAYQTPGNSYSQSGLGYGVSQGSGRSREDLYSYGRSYGTGNATSAGYANAGGVGIGMDRPLPPRNPGGRRPRSVDLVTPFGAGGS